jgi:peroxiredoxin
MRNLLSHPAWIVLLFAQAAFGAPAVGKPAPDFSIQDVSGKSHRLSDYKGKYVVLEWTNPGCPFVQKHYRSQNMQNLQKAWTAKNVVWLSINSTHPSHADYQSPDQAGAYMKKVGAAPSALLMDSDGKVGTSYAARTTPHMFVIDPQGKLIYAGAIDDRRSTDVEDVKTAKNFIVVALTEALGGKPVTTASTQPYGCSVKY